MSVGTSRLGAGATPSPWRTLWTLSWPLVLTMVANALTGVFDTWIAGKLGPTTQAAVGLTMQLVLLINFTTTAVSIGCQALVARFVGAGDWDQAARSAQQTLLLGLWMTLGLLGPIYLLAPWLYEVMGATPAVRDAGAAYLRWLLLGLIPMDLAILLNAVFRARGRTTALLMANGTEALVWVTGSLALGWYAGWGLAGLAVGFVAGKAAGLAVGWSLFCRSRIARHATAPWRTDWGWFRRILAIGMPAGVQVLLRNIGMMIYFTILGWLAHPTEAIAAFSIGARVESLAFLPVFAFNLAAATMVGQHLGAERPDEAEAMAWRIVAVAGAVMGVFSAIFLAFADALAGLFTQDPLVRAYAADYLRVMAFSEPFLGVAMVLNGAFQGAGEARVPLVLTVVAQLVVRLPLAWALALPFAMGPSGAWWAMTISMWLQAGLITWMFRRGGWKDRRI